MVLTSENIFNNANLAPFDKTIKDVIKNATMTFWELETDISLYAINDFAELKEEHLAQELNFFTTQMRVENHSPIVIRLNDEFVSSFLALALENDNRNFILNSLTPLEIKILNSFCEFLYKKLNEVLIPTKDLKPLKEEAFSAESKVINILYFIKAKKTNKSARLILTIPKDRIKLAKIQKIPSFLDTDFATSCTNVTIKVGTSKITLKDLRELESEDIILLEDSELTKSTLISGEYKQKFNVKINPSLIMDLGEDEESAEKNNQENMTNEVNMEKNLWDDIEVEIGAEFEKVKMSIGELKQITQGQIVDLGSIFESEISLYVENKKIATGELLIINDRYAVKLDKILSNPKARPVQSAVPAPKPAARPAPNAATPKPAAQAPKQAAPKPAAQAPRTAQARPAQPKAAQPKPAAEQKEDFDYSDFEK